LAIAAIFVGTMWPGVATAQIVCGDGACQVPGEDPCTCPQDCPNPGTEAGMCTDGQDNDCDMLIDCQDPDCFGDPNCAGATCEPVPGSGCSGPCQNPAVENCQAQCVVIDPQTGDIQATECACESPNDCHVEANFAAGNVAGGNGNACIVPDNGSGTIDLPPPNCGYLSPDDLHMIIDGLPVTNPPTMINIAIQHAKFFCLSRCQGGPNNGQICQTAAQCPGGICANDVNLCTFNVDCTQFGGGLGGEQECSNSLLLMNMTGTGALAGFNRFINMQAEMETHVGPRSPGDPVQSFDTDMFRLFGVRQNPGAGDPDFDLLRITAGTSFGLPSPGHTTLTRLGPPGSNWSVDSFFDIHYRIDFVGRPGGQLGGMSGSTTGTIRMSTGSGAKCAGDCPVGQVCEESRMFDADTGQITLCCNCVMPPACAPPAPGTFGGCSGSCPNPTVDICQAQCVEINGFTGDVTPTACDCESPNDCHVDADFSSGQAVAGGGNNPCVVPDNGGGTVTLPPEGCGYLSPDDVHMILDGLPVTNPPTTIELGIEHLGFFCSECIGGANAGQPCDSPADCPGGFCRADNPTCSHSVQTACNQPGGGALGGESECSESTLAINMSGTGNLAGFNRMINMRIEFETHTAPRMPGAPIQSFDADMFRLFGERVNPGAGDPDFDLLRIVAGTDFNLPSPGHTTLTRLGPPGSNWAVDSYFDINYRIDFVGRQGGALSGMMGSTTGTIRMSTGSGASCVGACPPNTECVEERTPPNAAGIYTLCCNCVDLGACCMQDATGWHCTMTSATDCVNGSFHPGQQCTGPQACCIPAIGGLPESCVNVDPLCCDEMGGTPQPGQTCSTAQPVACCLPGGICEDRDPVCCAADGGIPGPAGSTCDNYTCNQDCEPIPGTGCSGNCPNPAVDICQSKCVRINPQTGDVEATECDCIPPTECHVKAPFSFGQVAGGGGNPCVVPDNGGGTITLPPEGCAYLSPDDVHMILDGLPVTVPPTTIELGISHQGFFCTQCIGGANNGQGCDSAADCPGGQCRGENGNCSFSVMSGCDQPGGILLGEQECSESTLQMQMTGTGALAGFMRTLALRAEFETHVAPRNAGDPVQSFDTEMFRLFGQIQNPGSGDPDFDLLRIVAGTSFNLPSPGHTTLTRLGPPGSNWAVDSYFDINYRIDFIGRPGGPLGGMSGSTTGTIRMVTGSGASCVGVCPPDQVCEETRLVDATGQITLCCNCVDDICEPTDDAKDCKDACPCFGECINGSYCDDPACCIDPNNCLCYAPNHPFSIELCGDCFGECINGGYCDSPAPGCCVDPGNCLCYVPNHPISIALCGDCFGECIGDSYCDDVGDPACCADLSNCPVCYAPTHPTSILLCSDLPDTCKAKCGTLNPLTGQFDVTQCECLGDECHLNLPKNTGTPTPIASGTGDGCVVNDNGTGTVTLPPAGCEYLSPDEVHEIIDGLPPNTTIEFATIHKDFICNKQPGAGVCSFPPGVDCEEPGGSLGGKKECRDSTLSMDLKGTGALAGFMRQIDMAVSFETHTSPWPKDLPSQTIATDMFRLFGQMTNPGSGDPDFDLLRIVAGTDFGLPSPGHTTLTRLGPSGSPFHVDSFFDINYRIDFVGRPGGALGGMSGSTTGTIRMATGGAPACSNDCPPGMVCVQTKTVVPDGAGGVRIDICCDCQPQVCEPRDDGLACQPVQCPIAGEECRPVEVKCTANGCRVIRCECGGVNACHVVLPPAGQTLPACVGGCPNVPPPPNPRCERVREDLDGDGLAQEFYCRCVRRPPPTVGNDTCWNGAVNTGTPCSTNADCPTGQVCGLKSRYISVTPANASVAGGPTSSMQIEIVSMLACNAGANAGRGCSQASHCPGGACVPDATRQGDIWWAGAEQNIPDAPHPPLRGAQAQCTATPNAQLWTSGVVHLFGPMIVPGATYNVRMCDDTGGNCSPPILVGTGKWGDVIALFGGPTQPNFSDINSIVQKFQNLASAPSMPRADLVGVGNPGTPNTPNQVANFADISADVSAFTGFGYPFTVPDCP